MISRMNAERSNIVYFGCLICILLTSLSVLAQSADEAAIRKLDAEWSKTAGTLDVDKTVAFYSDDASVLPPNAPVVNTKTAIRALWAELLVPGTTISWDISKIEVAKSGDLAYVTGTYRMSMKGPDGKPMDDKGKMVEVFKKQPNTQWKCVADMFSSDLPAPVATK